MDEPQKRRIKVAGVWDIETADWDRFLCGEALDKNGNAFQSWDAEEFARYLLDQSGIWYAHAGGRFDMLWFLEFASRRGLAWSAKLRGSGILSARIGALELRDSFAILPMSLKKAAPMGGGLKTAIGLSCECGAQCGGYCALSRDLSDHERALVGEYLHNDCEVLLRVIENLVERCATLDIALGQTIGGTAWKTAQTWLDLPKCGHDLQRYERLRTGYYGGRTEVFRTCAKRGDRYDIHSSYPAALSRTPLPIGQGRLYSGQQARWKLQSDAPGIYQVRLTIPESFAPPLPVRMKHRLLYPHGPIEGTYTSVHLRNAIEHGAKVEKVIWGHCWEKCEPVLAPYAQRVWDLRDDAENPAWATWYKWLANSLTGKLAQRPENASIEFVPGCPPHIDDGVTVIRVTSNGAFIARERERVDDCAHVQWAAWLTSEASSELGRQLVHASRPIYCDTDSVYSVDPLTRRLGPNLGEWGHEGSMTDWRCLAPKVYKYRDEKGNIVVKGKGMSGLDADGFDALEDGDAWTVDRGVEGIRTALRKGPTIFRRKSLSRSVHPVDGWIGDRILLRNGVDTRPATVDEYLAHFEK